ncbi:MAG: hypothetical protein WA364_09960 [Candidatus Nitrosopolaris sp.]
MEHFDFHAKSLLVFYMAITLFIFHANLAAGSKDYSKVFHDLRNYSQYHVHTSMSPKSNVDFRLHNTVGLISLVGYVNMNKLTAYKFKPFGKQSTYYLCVPSFQSVYPE